MFRKTKVGLKHFTAIFAEIKFTSMNSRYLFFTVLLIATATVCKIVCGPNIALSGFSPVIAIALFSGMIVKDKSKSFLLPLFALLISDILIEVFFRLNWFEYKGFYKNQWINYLLLFSATIIGWLLQAKNGYAIVAGAIAAPTVFFLLSNFTVWFNDVHARMYSRGLDGLVSSYTAGLPFYKNALIGTCCFLPLILVSYNYLIKKKMALTLTPLN